MKSFWTAISIVLMLNVLVAAVGAGWLYNSDRVNRGRITQTLEIFELTLAQEKVEQQKADKVAAEVKKNTDELLRLQQAGDGEVTVAARLSADAQADELAMQKVIRLRQEIKSLQANVQTLRRIIEQQESGLKKQQDNFEQKLTAETQRRKSDGFKNAVTMYEQIKPRQTKAMFMELIRRTRAESDQAMARGEASVDPMRQVVEYLAAMQLRKAGAVLREFKDDREIVVVTELIERLRERGVDPLGREAQKASAAR